MRRKKMTVHKFRKSKKESNKGRMIELLESIDGRLHMLELCIKTNNLTHGDSCSLSTRHWND